MSTAVDKQELNKAVQALAAKERPTAVAILEKFGAMNTPSLAPDKYQAVFDECTAAVAKLERKP
jgi:hypothetical protein